MESLFLIEFLVDNVHFSNSTLGFDEATISELGRTLVKFEFLDYPSLEISEDDFKPNQNQDQSNVTFKNGKSCLFSLRGANPTMEGLCVYVSVMRARGSSCLCIGRATIPLGGSFAAILGLQKPIEKSPISKTTKDTYPLTNDRGSIVGFISIFVRLSCFGKMIVTQFQVGGAENKSFLFKGASIPSGLLHGGGGTSCTEMEEQIQNIPLDDCAFPNQEMNRQPSHGFFPPNVQPYGHPGMQGQPGPGPYFPDQLGPPTPYNLPYYGPQMLQEPCNEMAPYGGMEGQNPQQDDGRFKNFSAEINGYSLNIKILKRKKKKSQVCGRIMPLTAVQEDKTATEEH